MRRLSVCLIGLSCCLFVALHPSYAQTFTVLHSFTGGRDGASPGSGLAIDRGGNLYGNTYSGGNGYGVVFKLTHKSGGWVMSPLYTFAGGSDGAHPIYAQLSIAPDGSLYGTTYLGGGVGTCGSDGCGTVFKLRPSSTIPHSVIAPWQETILYRFTNTPDGARPLTSASFGNSGSLFLGTQLGGQFGDGAIVELTPSGTGWTETVVHSLQLSEGADPIGGLTFDAAGNIFGAAEAGGFCCGTVFELTPSGGGWTETTLHAFNGTDGNTTTGPLLLDRSGNLIGATVSGGSLSFGTIYELSPSLGGWTFQTLLSLPPDEVVGGPFGGLIQDSSGNVYGTTVYEGAFGKGSVFRLSFVNGNWVYTDLYNFTGGGDGEQPLGPLVMDGSGNLYGVAFAGASSACQGGCGTVWQLTP